MKSGASVTTYSYDASGNQTVVETPSGKTTNTFDDRNLFSAVEFPDTSKNNFTRLDLLILDELGYVPTSKLGSELLFEVISTSYERLSVIVTTHLPFENLTPRRSAVNTLTKQHLTVSLTAPHPRKHRRKPLTQVYPM